MATYDYTKDDVPFGDESPDDFVIAGDITGSDKSADEIEASNSFTAVPPGEHLLVVGGFPEAPKESHYKVMVNNRLDSFTAHSVRIRLHLPNNPNCTVTDFFLLPPSDPKQLNAYYTGIPEGKKQAGWAASKFIHFINRLGYPFPPGAKLPEAARRLGNWKGRTIYAMVEAGRPYTDKNGVEKPGNNQVKPFSYRSSQQTGVNVGLPPAAQGRMPATAAGAGTVPSQANRQVAPSHAAGLDNL